MKSDSSYFRAQSQYPSKVYRTLFGSRVYQYVQFQSSGELGQEVLIGEDGDGDPHKFGAVWVIDQVGSMEGSGVQNDDDDT